MAITLIQKGLALLGHDPGPADGIFGLRTRAAAEAWLAAGGAGAQSGIAAQTSAVIRQGSQRHPVTEAVIHCSDTPPDWMAGRALADQVAEIRRWHMQDRGWRDIGYHWLVGRDGKVWPGRRETEIGAHVMGHNAGTIGICLIGGKGSNATDEFREHFTPPQDVSLRGLLQGIGMRTPLQRISGHNEWAARACPGFHVPHWLDDSIEF